MEAFMNSALARIKEKIHRNELVVGTAVSLNDPVITEILGSCGFDFLWIEGEHSKLDRGDIDLHIMAAEKQDVASFVRVAWNDPVLAKPMLDIGASAIIFPFIKTKDEAELAVKSCKYPPRGIRGFGPIRPVKYGLVDTQEYLKSDLKEPWVILQIEHVDAVNNLDKILKVDGVDSVVVGPMDLSASIGLLGQTSHTEVLKLIDRVAEKCLEAGIPFGASIGFNEKNVSAWISRGASWLALDGDTDFLLGGGINCYKKTIELFRK